MSKKKTVKAKPTVNPVGFCVYIGPTIHGVIQNGTIYSVTREEALKKLSAVIEKYPLVKSLIVKDSELVEARKKVRSSGNLLYLNYQKLAGRKWGKDGF